MSGTFGRLLYWVRLLDTARRNSPGEVSVSVAGHEDVYCLYKKGVLEF